MLRKKFIGLLLLLMACEEVVEIDLPDAQELVTIEGWLTNEEEIQRIRITRSNSFTSGDTSNYIPNLDVYTISDIGEIMGYNYGKQGFYDSEEAYAGQIGTSYRLVVLLNDSVTVASEWENMLPPPDIIASAVQSFEERNEVTGEIETLFFPRVFAIDSSGYSNFYRWRFYRNSISYEEPNPIAIQNDEFFDGNLIPNTFDEFSYQQGDTAIVKLISITRPAYTFLETTENLLNTLGTSSASTPSTIQGNFESNIRDQVILGYFGTESLVKDTIVFE